MPKKPPPSSGHIFHPAYRRDIDGLRAIAVLSVVIFHALPNVIPGGFIGVDIFFVISGYLISTIILRSIKHSKFSILEFYKKRILRIFPALALVLTFSIALGWITFTATEFSDLGGNIFAGASFFSNIHLLGTDGYFHVNSEFLPLMHLWSLGVEEQYYVVWPILLWVLWRTRLNTLTFMILAILASFLFSIHTIKINTNLDFYSPLSRFWELASGGCLAYIHTNRKKTFFKFISSANTGLNRLIFARNPVGAPNFNLIQSGTGFLGAGLYIYAASHLNSFTPFPGAYALYPVAAGVLIIAAGERSLVNRLLSNRILVWFGLISYPLYLWHWPLLSFYTSLYAPHSVPQDRNLRILIVLLSIFLSWATYRFVERHIRNNRHSFIKAAGLSLFLFVIGYAGYAIALHGGYPSRQVVKRNQSISDSMKLGNAAYLASNQCGLSGDMSFCNSDKAGKPNLYLWGDSKADALFWGLIRLPTVNGHWGLIGYSSTPPVASGSFYQEYQQQGNGILPFLEERKDINAVVLVFALRSIFKTSTYHFQDGPTLEYENKHLDDATKALTETISRLQRSGKAVIFVIDNPTPKYDPKLCFRAYRRTGITALDRHNLKQEEIWCQTPIEENQQVQSVYLQLIASIKKALPRTTVYDPTHLLCSEQTHSCPTAVNGKFLYSYGDHISDYSNILIARELMPLVTKAIANRDVQQK
ncbi:acyltransferase family protein [Azospira inquinata]|uniref:Acyltransferase n=1 Tax=Azospira inquinata TaxID=2785627 RepID=A0A975SL62_9RHOO|nr:acyltransferase family protein [Azospira inquinata]QWT46746.1 acyltransferase [Azospira inquinata]QWT47930.1 acyltransferase [Azospira inquinata]